MLTMEVLPLTTLAMTCSSLEFIHEHWLVIEDPCNDDHDSAAAERCPSESDPPVSLEPSKPASLPVVHYAYDPVPAQPRRLHLLTSRMPEWAAATCSSTSINSLRLDPWSANLPYRSSLPCVRASKHWESNLDETLRFLRLLAADRSAADIGVKHGITLAKLAKTALHPGYEDQMVLAAHYMFPAAEEERMRLIAALTVMYFVFDGTMRR